MKLAGSLQKTFAVIKWKTGDNPLKTFLYFYGNQLRFSFFNGAKITAATGYAGSNRENRFTEMGNPHPAPLLPHPPPAPSPREKGYGCNCVWRGWSPAKGFVIIMAVKKRNGCFRPTRLKYISPGRPASIHVLGVGKACKLLDAMPGCRYYISHNNQCTRFHSVSQKHHFQL